MVEIRRDYLEPLPAFADAFRERCVEGLANLSSSSVAIVGLARNCADPLASNLALLEPLTSSCREWRLHIEANDCVDHTPQVLADFCREHKTATFAYQQLGRESYTAEFAGRRTVAMAEYRRACQAWVRHVAAGSDYVIAIDWDQWGGWSHDGVVNGIGWLVELPGAYGMASVSLFQYDFGAGPQWAHYDLWALRGVGQARCYWDTYTNGYGGFGYSWLPAIGSPPVLVSSAFGGLVIYRTEAFLAGVYDGTDCEHVPFHRSIAEATGQHLYMNPSQRCVMHWMQADGRQHDDH